MFLKKAWDKWLKIAHKIGNFQAQVILTIFYFVIILPMGLVMRIADPIHAKKPVSSRSNFQKWEHPQETLEEARKQY